MPTMLAEAARSAPLEFIPEEKRAFIRVLAQRDERNRNCCQELFFGVFFDGTNNNQVRDEELHSQSNVARLSLTFPKKENDGYFRIYLPGVGTKFDDVGDTGEGDDLVWGQTDRRRGLAFAEKGEARIVWALLTVLNSLSQYFTGHRLRSGDQLKKLANDLTEANAPLWASALNPAASAAAQWLLKRRLIDSKRNEVLGELCKELEQKVAAARRLRPDPKVLGIRLSVFGFSRGAAQARVFANWFLDMCHAASGSQKLCGLDVDFDFLGLFDTVASVGLANSSLIADGHMEWADAERNLRIPSAVTRCVHLVSAHEVRRSFPLDSIAVGNSLPDKYIEVVYPGVHSDVGGGYLPTEQGRGIDPQGHDMLSRVPLSQMYREARLANVPLDVDGPSVTAEAKAALQVAPSTVAAFNAYLETCRIRRGRLADILDEQTRLYVRWRRLRLDNMATLGSVQRATPQDRTDILEANKELAEEARQLSTPLENNSLSLSVHPVVTFIKFGRRVVDAIEKRGIDRRHFEEFQKLRADWENPGNLPAGVTRLFDDWVHDSRAWFKPLGDDDHIWERKQRQRMAQLARRQELRQRLEEAAKVTPGIQNNPMIPPLTEAEKRELENWQKHQQLPTQPNGREPFMTGGGYLRYRRVYYGSDANIVAMAPPGQRAAA